MFSYRNRPILKTLGQFENLGIVIMSTRENIRLIARAPSLTKQKHQVLDLKAPNPGDGILKRKFWTNI